MSSDEDLSFPFICEGPSNVLEVFGESCGRLSNVSSGTDILEKEEERVSSPALDGNKSSYKVSMSIPTMEDNMNTSQDVLFCDSKEESSETSTNSAKFVQLSESLIKDNIDDVHGKMKDPGSCEDDCTVGDTSEKSKQNSGDVSERLDEDRLGVLFISNNVTEDQVPGSTEDSCEATLIKSSQTFEEELDSLEKLAMETVTEIECKLSGGSKLASVSNTDSDLPREISNKDLNEDRVDNTLDKRSISSDIEGLSSSESVQTSKDDVSHTEKKSFEDSDSSSSLAKSDNDLIVKEDLSNTSEKMESSVENRSENADLLKDEKESLPSMKCEDSSDNHSSADDNNLPSAVATADDNNLPVSGTDNSEQSSERETENIANQLGENMVIPISEQIPSDSEDSKGEKITSTISSESPMNIEIDESVSCDASCELNKPEGFSSSESSKLPSTEKEICTESEDVKNYETEDDDLKVLEAFIVKSATNPEIAVCQTKQSEENTSKYSLESSLLDDLTKTDEVESVTHATKHEGVTSPKSSTKNTAKTMNRSENISQSINSKLRLSEELERASLEIASVLDSCSPTELKAKISTRRPMKPKSLCCVGKVLPLKKRLSPRKISDFDDRVDEKSNVIVQNFTGKNLSKSLTPGIVKRGRGRPPGSGKKLKLDKNLKPEKIQQSKSSEPKEISGEETIEECRGIVRKEVKPTGTFDNKDNNVLSNTEKPQPSEKYTETSESSTPFRSQRRKRKIVEFQKDSFLELDSVVRADSVASRNMQPVNGNQNNLFVGNLNNEQRGTISTYRNVNEVENICKKFTFPKIIYPFCTSILTFDQLKSKAKEITLPSPLWSVQVDATRDCIAFLGAASDISESRMVLEKAVLFEKTLEPVLILQNELINVPYCSLENFEDVALLIENFHHLQVCEGTAVKQRPFSKYCYKFVDVTNTGQRCSQCIEERRRVLFCYTRKLREKLTLLEKS